MQQEPNEPTKKRRMLPILGMVLGLALAIGVALWLFLPMGEPTPEGIAKAHIDGNIDEIGEEIAGFLSVGIPVVGKVAEELGGEYLEALIHEVIEWDYSDAKLTNEDDYDEDVYEVEATALVALDLNVPGLVDGDLDASMPFRLFVDMNERAVVQRIPLVSDATVDSDLPGLDGIAGIAGIGGIASVVSTANDLTSGAPNARGLLNTMFSGGTAAAAGDKPTQSGSPTSAPIPTATPASPFGGHSVLARLTPTPTPAPAEVPATPTPIPATELERQFAQRYAEDLERCHFSAALQQISSPHAWVEFTNLDPSNMTDLQRSLWIGTLGQNGHCWPYFAERLSSDNAHKRNWQYQAECFIKINKEKNQFYREAGRYIHNKQGHPHTVNQYARVMNFLELTGPELMAMDVKPHELFLQLFFGRNYNPAQVFIVNLMEGGPTINGSRDGYIHLSENEPSSGRLMTPYEAGDTPIPKGWLLKREGFSHTPLGRTHSNGDVDELTDEEVEWYGFGRAFHVDESCRKYFPQMFTGYWIPFHNQYQPVEPVPELEGERDLLIPDRYQRDN